MIGRKAAKDAGLTQYFTGKPCVNGHIALRWVSGWGCVDCQRERAISEDRRTYMREYQRNNPDKIKARNKRWKDRNREFVRQRGREWHKANPGQSRANTMRRRAALMRATPLWADQEKITAFYVEAARLTRETGRPHEVDHVIPLQGRRVSGLHVHTNLRVVERGPNRRKSNLYDP